MARRQTRFTIYDVLEAQGLFETNPANQNSREAASGLPLYTGPVEFPKMLYHPEGVREVLVKGEYESTIMGPRKVNEQSQVIHRIVGNKAEEKVLLDDGWKTTPSGAVLLIDHSDRIAELEAQIRSLQAAKQSNMSAILPAVGDPTLSGDLAD